MTVEVNGWRRDSIVEEEVKIKKKSRISNYHNI